VEQLPNPLQQEGRVMILKNHRHQFILSFQFGSQFAIHLKIFQTPCSTHLPSQALLCKHQMNISPWEIPMRRKNRGIDLSLFTSNLHSKSSRTKFQYLPSNLSLAGQSFQEQCLISIADLELLLFF